MLPAISVGKEVQDGDLSAITSDFRWLLLSLLELLAVSDCKVAGNLQSVIFDILWKLLVISGGKEVQD